MIEILVAVLVLATGLLATARMQVASLRFSQTAYNRSQAYLMATDMIDRMRANTGGAVAGAYDGLTTSGSSVDPGCDDRRCDSGQIALQDLHDWSRRLHAGERGDDFVPLLPSVSGVVAVGRVDRVAEGVYRVTLTWTEPDGAGFTEASLSMSVATEVPG